jgi:hypothetical protein
MSRKQWFGTVLPFGVWVATTLEMLRGWRNDPYNPALKGSDTYFHNGPGALGWGVLFTTIDIVVLYAVLRPWSYDRSWRRALAALLLFTPWAFLNAITVVHAGSVRFTHILSVLAVWLGLAVLFAVSGVVAFVQWRQAREAAAAG